MQISRKYGVATLLSLCLIHIGVPSLVRGEKEGKLNEPSLVAPDRVGSRGDPQRIIISSNETFTAAAIRKGLGRNRDFIVASHSEASYRAMERPEDAEKLEKRASEIRADRRR